MGLARSQGFIAKVLGRSETLLEIPLFAGKLNAAAAAALPRRAPHTTAVTLCSESPMRGNTRSAPSITTNAAAPYPAAMRRTFRRFNSSKKLMAIRSAPCRTRIHFPPTGNSPAGPGGGQPPPGGRTRTTTVIEGQYEEVDTGDEPMPPPKGDWNRRR